jgi:hypothetical protein
MGSSGETPKVIERKKHDYFPSEDKEDPPIMVIVDTA